MKISIGGYYDYIDLDVELSAEIRGLQYFLDETEERAGLISRHLDEALAHIIQSIYRASDVKKKDPTFEVAIYDLVECVTAGIFRGKRTGGSGDNGVDVKIIDNCGRLVRLFSCKSGKQGSNVASFVRELIGTILFNSSPSCSNRIS